MHDSARIWLYHFMTRILVIDSYIVIMYCIPLLVVTFRLMSRSDRQAILLVIYP